MIKNKKYDKVIFYKVLKGKAVKLVPAIHTRIHSIRRTMLVSRGTNRYACDNTDAATTLGHGAALVAKKATYETMDGDFGDSGSRARSGWWLFRHGENENRQG
jgi:hypothetical protein